MSSAQCANNLRRRRRAKLFRTKANANVARSCVVVPRCFSVPPERRMISREMPSRDETRGRAEHCELKRVCWLLLAADRMLHSATGVCKTLRRMRRRRLSLDR